jgi:hypothetical protein
MSENFFYVQSMADKMNNYSQEYTANIIDQMFVGQKTLDSQLNNIFMAGLTFGVLSLVFGIILINYMKKLYFK